MTNYVGIHVLRVTRSNKLKPCSQTQPYYPALVSLQSTVYVYRGFRDTAGYVTLDLSGCVHSHVIRFKRAAM